MKEITKVVEFDGRTGKNTVTITVRRGYQVIRERLNADGWDMGDTERRTAVEDKDISAVFGNGKSASGLYLGKTTFQGTELDALICSTFRAGLSPENAALVKAAITEAVAEAEADNAEWDEIVKQRKELDEYEERTLAVNRAMTLDGHTY